MITEIGVLVLLVLVILGLRFAFRLYKINHLKPVDLKKQALTTEKINLLVVFGSGGHTTEMNMILKDYDFLARCQNVYFLKAETDKVSKTKIKQFHEENQVKIQPTQITWIDIPRSREVKQNYLSSIITTIRATIYTFIRLRSLKVDVLLLNGPGTCVPVALVLILQWILFLRKPVKIIFIESWCRVKYLSLTGKILYFLVDRIIVHWQDLAKKYKKCQYLGNII